MEEKDKQIAKDLENLSNETIGKNISGIRLLKNMPRLKLAERADIDYSYLGEIERGEVTISHFILLKICIALELTNSSRLYDDVPADVKRFLKEINPID